MTCVWHQVSLDIGRERFAILGGGVADRFQNFAEFAFTTERSGARAHAFPMCLLFPILILFNFRVSFGFLFSLSYHWFRFLFVTIYWRFPTVHFPYRFFIHFSHSLLAILYSQFPFLPIFIFVSYSLLFTSLFFFSDFHFSFFIIYFTSSHISSNLFHFNFDSHPV